MVNTFGNTGALRNSGVCERTSAGACGAPKANKIPPMYTTKRWREVLAGIIVRRKHLSTTVLIWLIMIVYLILQGHNWNYLHR